MAQLDPSSYSKETTIYNYRLVKRLHHSIIKVALYFFILLAGLFYIFSLTPNPHVWVPIVTSYPLLLIAHFVIVRIYFQFTVGSAMRGWSFRWGIFWSGLLPEGNASVRLVRKVQLHLFWVGITIVASLYPWLSDTWLSFLLLFHVWMLFPRLWMMFRFQPYLKNGLVKITGKDTSCYLQ